MVSSKKKMCKICNNKADQYIPASEKVYGKELLTTIKKISGNEALELPPTFLICTPCALALLQAEDIVSRLSLALAAIQTVKKEKIKFKIPATLNDGDSQKSGSDPDSHLDIHKRAQDGSLANWQFNCHLCPYTSDKPKLYKKHLLVKHQLNDPRIYKCPQCKESYQRSNGIHNHIAIVHEKQQKPIRQRRKTIDVDDTNSGNKEPEEAKVANTSTELIKMQETSNVATNSKMSYTFKCDKCEYSVTNPKTFKKHLMMKHDDSSVHIYKCDLCNATYQRLYGLQNHIAYVHEKKPRPIPQRRKSVPPDFVCGSAEPSTPEQSKNNTSKQNSDMQVCDYCPFATIDKHSLKKHVVLQHQIDNIAGDKQNGRENHANEPKAIAVDSLFQKPKDLQTFNGTENSKSSWMFRCEHCPYETSKKKLFRDHLSTKHSIENAEVYKCTECGDTYKRQNLLEFHYAHAHERGLSICAEESFVSDASLDNTANSELKETPMFNKKSTILGTSLDFSAIPPIGKKSNSKEAKEPLMSSKNSTMLSDSSMNNLLIEKKKKLKHVKNLSLSFDSSMVDDIDGDLTNSSPAKKQKLSKKNEVCNICGKTFTTLEKLRSHVDRNHEGDKFKHCDNCGAQFYSEEKYNAHIFAQKCLKAKLSCQFPGCDKRFNSKSKLELHMHSKHPMMSDGSYVEDIY